MSWSGIKLGCSSMFRLESKKCLRGNNLPKCWYSHTKRMKMRIGMSIHNPEDSSDPRARIMPSIALGMPICKPKGSSDTRERIMPSIAQSTHPRVPNFSWRRTVTKAVWKNQRVLPTLFISLEGKEPKVINNIEFIFIVLTKNGMKEWQRYTHKLLECKQEMNHT